jgi:hypothetical protein
MCTALDVRALSARLDRNVGADIARRCLKAAVFSTMHGFDEQMFGAE